MRPWISRRAIDSRVPAVATLSSLSHLGRSTSVQSAGGRTTTSSSCDPDYGGGANWLLLAGRRRTTNASALPIHGGSHTYESHRFGKPLDPEWSPFDRSLDVIEGDVSPDDGDGTACYYGLIVLRTLAGARPTDGLGREKVERFEGATVASGATRSHSRALSRTEQEHRGQHRTATSRSGRTMQNGIDVARVRPCSGRSVDRFHRLGAHAVVVGISGHDCKEAPAMSTPTTAIAGTNRCCPTSNGMKHKPGSPRPACEEPFGDCRHEVIGRVEAGRPERTLNLPYRADLPSRAGDRTTSADDRERRTSRVSAAVGGLSHGPIETLWSCRQVRCRRGLRRR